MTESVRPSGADEARAAALAAEQKKTKQTQQAGQQGAQAAGLGQDKKLKASAFDELLKSASDQGAASLLPPEQKFDTRLKEISHEDERHSDQNKDDDNKPSDKGESGKKTKEPASGVKERVLAKHGGGEHQGSGSDSGGGKREGGGSQRGFQKDTAQAQAFAADLKHRDPVPVPVPVDIAQIQKAATVVAPEAAAAPRELPKALLDQIIQSVTIIEKADLGKEMEIKFHDKIFNGLKLKVSSHGSEVSVEFIVPNRTVEETFKQERENIALALGDKGVDVRSINVTRMT